MYDDSIFVRVRRIVVIVFKIFVAWPFIAPLVVLIPRRRNWVAVMGHHGGSFAGNSKYFYLQGMPILFPSNRVAFITDRRSVAAMFAGSDYEVLVYPSLCSIWYLVRAGTLVMDSGGSANNLRGFLLIGIKKIQLGHGVGFKRIGKDEQSSETYRSRLGLFKWPWFLKFKSFVHGSWGDYDLVNTSSAFYRENVFKKAMPSRNFIVAGYPRNTFGNTDDPWGQLVWKNVDKGIVSQIPSWLATSRRMVLVAPTFRETRSTPIGLDASIIEMLSAFCDREEIVFVFKFHPYERRVSQIKGRNLHLLGSETDVYPLMPFSSALITDYSSIYMDYLLLDKPVHFYVPDMDEYKRKDREFQFDFDAMTPGPKLLMWKDILASLLKQWEQDDYIAERANLRRLAFDDIPQEQAVPKIIEFMQNKNWISPVHLTESEF